MDGIRDIEARNCAARKILDAPSGAKFVLISWIPVDDENMAFDLMSINSERPTAIGLVEDAKFHLLAGE